MIWPLQLILYSFTCCCPRHLYLKKQAPATSLCWSTYNVKSCDCDGNFSGNSFRCYPVSVCFSQTSKDKQHTFGKCFLRRGGNFHTEVNTVQDVQDVILKHSAAILLLNRRKWDQTQSLCLMKLTHFVWGYSKKKTPEAHLCACGTLLLPAKLSPSTCSKTDDLHCPASVRLHYETVLVPCDLTVHPTAPVTPQVQL